MSTKGRQSTKTSTPRDAESGRLVCVSVDGAAWVALTADTRRRLHVPVAVGRDAYFRARWRDLDAARTGVWLVAGDAADLELAGLLRAAGLEHERRPLGRWLRRVGDLVWTDPAGSGVRASVEAAGTPVLRLGSDGWAPLDLLPGLWPDGAPPWLAFALPGLAGAEAPERSTGVRYAIEAGQGEAGRWRPRRWTTVQSRRSLAEAQATLKLEAILADAKGAWVRLRDRATGVTLSEIGRVDGALTRITYDPRRRGRHGRREPARFAVAPA